MFTWLKNLLSPAKPPKHAEPMDMLRKTGAYRRLQPVSPPDPETVKPLEKVTISHDLGGTIESAGPGKNVLKRKRIVREDTGTHDTLKILDDSLLDNNDDGGIDPYNTGRFDRSKSWDIRQK